MGGLGLAEHGIGWRCHIADVAVHALKRTHTHTGSAAASIAPLLFRSTLAKTSLLRRLDTAICKDQGVVHVSPPYGSSALNQWKS